MWCRVRITSIILGSILLIAVSAYTAYPYLFPEKRIRLLAASIPDGIKADSIVVFKEKREMILYSNKSEIRKYSVSLGRNPVGDKQQEGDKKTPEGVYKIDYKNPNSKYHLSLRISYPNEADKKEASDLGVPPGGDIMIHGLPNNMSMLEEYYLSSDWTDGCIAVSNQEIEEIWDAVDIGIPIVINK